MRPYKIYHLYSNEDVTEWRSKSSRRNLHQLRTVQQIAKLIAPTPHKLLSILAIREERGIVDVLPVCLIIQSCLRMTYHRSQTCSKSLNVEYSE